MSDPGARPFTGMALDRATVDRKDPARLAELLRDPAARAVAAGPDGVLMAGSAGSPALLRMPAAAARDGAVLLGLEDGAPLFALDIDEAGIEPGALGRIVSLREAGALLPLSEAGLAAYLVALLNWHRVHRFCANCGSGTLVEEAGYSRKCTSCGTTHFPRTDPVVIMTVEHDGRLLLGRRVGWEHPRYSVLAGFVSPGESAEEAVIREVREESGIVARNPLYVTSQPWPFPSSLMLGFEAQADGGEPAAGDDELADVAWFPAEAVRGAMSGRNPDLRLPPPISVARFLIERWVARH